jgi:hypothetical protein
MGCSGGVCNFTLPLVKFMPQEKAPYAPGHLSPWLALASHKALIP